MFFRETGEVAVISDADDPAARFMWGYKKAATISAICVAPTLLPLSPRFNSNVSAAHMVENGRLCSRTPEVRASPLLSESIGALYEPIPVKMSACPRSG